MAHPYCTWLWTLLALAPGLCFSFLLDYGFSQHKYRLEVLIWGMQLKLSPHLLSPPSAKALHAALSLF